MYVGKTSTVCSVLLGIVFFASFAGGTETGRGLTDEEIEAVAESMRQVEDSLVNVRIDANAWIEKGPSPSGPWGKTYYSCSTTSYYGKVTSDKSRIDFHKEVSQWKNGAAPYIQYSYSMSFNGEEGRKKYISSSYNGKTIDREDGYILPKSLGRLSGYYSHVTGIEASFLFHYRGLPEPIPERFSTNFQANADPNGFLAKLAAADPNYANLKIPCDPEVVWEEFRGRQCIKTGCTTGLAPTEMWIDPNRGFALLKVAHYRREEPNGPKQLVSSINVTELKKVGENIWWPMEADFVKRSHTDPESWQRTVYRASNVVVNDADFDESVFNVEFPKGYRIQDKVRNITYTIGQNRNSPKR